MDSEENLIEDVLSDLISLSERVCSAVDEAKSFELGCGELSKRVYNLGLLLTTAFRFAASTPTLYERPLRRVLALVSENLHHTLFLVRNCKNKKALRCVTEILTSADFRKVDALLDSSIGDMKWLLAIFKASGGDGSGAGDSGGGGVVLSISPIANKNPILSWVWSFITSIHMGQLPDRIEATNELASLAQDNERNKEIIVEERGIVALLKLLKEGPSSEAQIAALKALYVLADNQDRVWNIVDGLGVLIIVQVLGNSPMILQIQAAKLVARMAEHDSLAKDDFRRANAIGPLVTLLSFEIEISMDLGRQSSDSIVQINKNLGKKSHGKTKEPRAGHHRRERQNEKPEVKLQLKTACAEALWMLAKGSVLNSRMITETKGLLCLAKMVEREDGELRSNCLMTLMEITAAAEINADLRCAAFKRNSPAPKAVVDLMLSLIMNLDDDLALLIPAIRSIGSLARTFSAKETRVIHLLLNKLKSMNLNVVAEAAISLGKFVCVENFLRMEHSRTIIEFDGIPDLLSIVQEPSGHDEKTRIEGLILLCNLVLLAGKTERLFPDRVLPVLEGADQTLPVLEGADQTLVANDKRLIDLIDETITHLKLYHVGDEVGSKRYVKFYRLSTRN